MGTSHIIITFTLSFSIFIGINIIGVNRHGFNMLSLIIPANSGFAIALILVPIEFISYLVRPISLGVRVFINLMAGHALLKVIVGFSWSMLLLENFISLIHLVPFNTCRFNVFRISGSLYTGLCICCSNLY